MGIEKKDVPILACLLLAAAKVALGVGPDSGLLAGRADDLYSERVDAVFAAYDRPDSPGCALSVMRDGRIIYERGYGMANLDLGVPNSPATIFDIGSTSKQFTAASIVLLAQRGKLALDDDIRKYVPEIPATRRPITIRQMLHHTSGLRDYLDLMELAGVQTEDLTTDGDALAVLARQRDTNFPPGDEHLYSNSGFFLMSVVVKRVTGKSLRDFAQENIFGPLGMRQTRFHDDHTRIEPGRATGYEPRDGGGFRIDMSNFEQTGDGSVFTNVEDLEKWDENFYRPKVGGQALVDELQTRGVLTSGETIDYALGLYVDAYRGVRRVSHGGSWAGYRAELARFPGQHVSVACLCNLGTASPSDLAMKVADIYLADVFKEPAPAAESVAPGEAAGTGEEARPGGGAGAGSGAGPAAEELRALAGIYRDPRTEEIVAISADGGRLKVARYDATSELTPIAGRRFRVSGSRTEIAFEDVDAKGGTPRRLRRSVEGEKPQTFTLIVPVAPGASRLAEYAGTYYSDELQAGYRLVVENGKLFVRARNLPQDPLLPTVTDVFAVDELTFKFERDGRKRVTGFALGAGRIRNVRFVREGLSAQGR